MASWLNFNESLNNIKGQITNFASNVLADEEGKEDINNKSYEELQKLCLQKDTEIQSLQGIIEELQNSTKIRKPNQNDGINSNWDWTTTINTSTSGSNTESENINSDLKQQIKKLENEKQDLVTQLEQLDIENQQNLSKLIGIREKLQDENDTLRMTSDKYKEENRQLKNELETLKNAENSDLQVQLERSNKELIKIKEKLQKSETENKIIYSELNKAKEHQKLSENKSKEDKENYEKLAFILDSYEKQVSTLKDELSTYQNNENLDNISEKLRAAEDENSQLRQELEETKKLVEHQQEKLKEEENLKNKNAEQKYIDVLSIFENRLKNTEQAEKSAATAADNDVDSEIFEFTSQMSEIVEKYIEENTDFEKRLADLSITENEQHTSKVLKQQTENINRLQMEIGTLMLINDELLTELQSYRNTKLQTISETNEDNVASLETALENAHKEIDQLKNNSATTSKKEDYYALLNDFDNLKIDYDTLMKESKETEEKLAETVMEKDRLKMEFDALYSDLTQTKNALQSLQSENDRLRNETKNNIDIKSDMNELKLKLISEKNTRMELETKLKNQQKTTEENETVLKLQHDMLKNENIELNEKKIELENELTKSKLSFNKCEENYTELLQKYDEILRKCEELNQIIVEKENECLKLANNAEFAKEIEEKDGVIENLQRTIEQYEIERNEANVIIEQQNEKYEVLNREKTAIIDELQKQFAVTSEEQRQLIESQKKSDENLRSSLEQQLQELAASRNELISIVKTKHDENIVYHNEIKRLTDILNSENDRRVQLETQLIQVANANEEIARKNEEIDKLTDECNFLREEQTKLQQAIQMNQRNEPSEKELNLSKQLERLQSHLMEVEEHYTEELVQMETIKNALQLKIADLEQREKNSNTLCTSVSVRANQQVESLQNQLQMAVSQREELRKQISDADDANKKQSAALANLQIVLEQFQKDRDNDIQRETERIKKQIAIEKQIQKNLSNEIDNLKLQLDESKQGLQAAARLSDQLEQIKLQNLTLKDEVTQLKNELSKSARKIQDLTSQTDGKIEKCLIKNLIIGFLSSGNPNFNKDQVQVLKIISAVLDFNQQDHDKIKLNKPQQGSWLSSILAPYPNSPDMSQEQSLSQAFIKFLEQESKPRVVPSLLNNNNDHKEISSSASSSRRSSLTTPSPIVLNEIVLPTFADFGQIRNSSSILKDVLKDNNQ